MENTTKTAIEILSEQMNVAKRLAQKLSRVDAKAAESEAEVEKCNDTMRKMMDGEVAQTGISNIATEAREQQKFFKRAEKVRNDAVVDAEELEALSAAIKADFDALTAPYAHKFSNQVVEDESEEEAGEAELVEDADEA